MIDDKLVFSISKKFNINFNDLLEFVKSQGSEASSSGYTDQDNSKNFINTNIILPFCGVIYEKKCKAVIYNHGLYTQCLNDSHDFCSKCKNSNLKYGDINARAKFELGKFEINGRKEIDYNKFIKKMKYNIQDVLDVLRSKNLEYNLLDCSCVKKGRGRPKKNIKNLEIPEKEDSEEEIEVEIVIINGVEYYQTQEQVLLDRVSHEVVGLNVNNKIEKIEK